MDKQKTGRCYSLKLVKEREFNYKITDSTSIAELFKTFLAGKAEEYVYMVCLTSVGGIAGIFEVSHGDLSTSLMHPREIFKRALLTNAASVIVAHNHPSGDISPSEIDIEATERLKDAGELMGVKVWDHLIIGDGDDYYSFKRDGRI